MDPFGVLIHRSMFFKIRLPIRRIMISTDPKVRYRKSEPSGLDLLPSTLARRPPAPSISKINRRIRFRGRWDSPPGGYQYLPYLIFTSNKSIHNRHSSWTLSLKYSVKGCRFQPIFKDVWIYFLSQKFCRSAEIGTLYVTKSVFSCSYGELGVVILRLIFPFVKSFCLIHR